MEISIHSFFFFSCCFEYRDSSFSSPWGGECAELMSQISKWAVSLWLPWARCILLCHKALSRGHSCTSPDDRSGLLWPESPLETTPSSVTTFAPSAHKVSPVLKQPEGCGRWLLPGEGSLTQHTPTGATSLCLHGNLIPLKLSQDLRGPSSNSWGCLCYSLNAAWGWNNSRPHSEGWGPVACRY